MNEIVTPQAVEKRLRDLGRELDDAQAELVLAEDSYAKWKSEFEVNCAKARLRIGKAALAVGQKITVQEKEDQALVECEVQDRGLLGSEAVVKATRANMQRIKTQIDIARSVGTSVRSSMELA